MDTNRRSFFGKLLVAPLLPLVAAEPEPVKTVTTVRLDARILKAEMARACRAIEARVIDLIRRGAFD